MFSQTLVAADVRRRTKELRTCFVRLLTSAATIAPAATATLLLTLPLFASDRSAVPEELVPLLSSGAYMTRMEREGKVQWPKPIAGPALRMAELTSISQTNQEVQVGSDPTGLPAERRSQAEPHLARSQWDPNFLLGTMQEGRFTDGGAVSCSYAISRDGGLSWQRELLPSLIQSDGGPFERLSDPVAAIGPDGNLYVNVLGVKNVAPAAIAVSRSTNQGASWDPPVIFAAATNSVEPDKNWMTINDYPTMNATSGRIVVSFTEFHSTGATIALCWSDDQGKNWTKPKRIGPTISQGSQPFFLPDGSLGVIYSNFGFNYGDRTDDRIEMRYSPDGGNTFNQPVIVAPWRTHNDPLARDAQDIVSAATDRQAGVIYVAYQAIDSVPLILVTRSTDKGRTWSKPAPANDTPGGRSVFNPVVAVSPDGQHVTVMFYDKRNDTGEGYLVDIYLAQSFDAGATWQPNIRLTSAPSDMRLTPLTPTGYMLGDYQGLVPSWGFTAPGVGLWIDTRNGQGDPFAGFVPRTRGTTFETWRQLRFNAADLLNPSVSGAAGDSDGDGFSNLFEYVVGGELNRADRWKISMINPGLTAFYSQLGVMEDYDLAWEQSIDLRNWVSAAPLSSAETEHTGGLYVQVQDQLLINSEPYRFYRLVVKP